MRFRETIIWRNKFKLIGVILLGYILYNSDPAKILEALSDISWPLYILVLFISAPTIFLKSLRWKTLIPRHEPKNLKVKDAWLLYWIAIFWGAVTPGKVGELFKVKYLFNRGISAGGAVAATIVDRMMDMILLLLLVYAGTVLYSTEFSTDILLFSVILCGGLVLIIILYLFRKKVYQVFLKFTKRILVRSRAEKISAETENMFSAVRKYTIKTWLIGLSITLITWIFFVFQRYIVAISMGLEVDLIYFSITMFIMAFVTLIPVSIEGIGTRDAVLVYMLGSTGIESHQSVALSTLILIIMIFNTLVGYLLYSFTTNKNIK